MLVLLAILLASAVGAGAYYFGYARYTTIPAVLKLPPDLAEQRLQAAGLDVQQGEARYSETIEEGLVLSIDPAPGERVLRGTDVTIAVSLGRAVAVLPKLTGITLDEAQDRILNANMAFGSATEKFSEKVPAGIVISSNPKGEETYRFGTVVDLVVSRGRRPIPVGSWAGKSAEDAQRALERRNLKVAVSREYSDTVARGLVISQDPRDGTLFKGDTVRLVVSVGPELIEVPNVIASGVDAAIQTLENAGFKVQVENAPGYLGLGYVFSMSPERGELLAKGSTVTIYLI